jgi:hypothetical protein
VVGSKGSFHHWGLGASGLARSSFVLSDSFMAEGLFYMKNGFAAFMARSRNGPG